MINHRIQVFLRQHYWVRISPQMHQLNTHHNIYPFKTWILDMLILKSLNRSPSVLTSARDAVKTSQGCKIFFVMLANRSQSFYNSAERFVFWDHLKRMPRVYSTVLDVQRVRGSHAQRFVSENAECKSWLLLLPLRAVIAVFKGSLQCLCRGTSPQTSVESSPI